MSTNKVNDWITDAVLGGYLRSAFIDCQGVEFTKLRDTTPFTNAQKLAVGLRTINHNSVHFLYDELDQISIRPFQYKDKPPYLKGNTKRDFAKVIPHSDEWVYPKKRSDGFENPHAAEIFQDKATLRPLEKTLLICAGFVHSDCLIETATGSFSAVTTPLNHRVIVAMDATNFFSSRKIGTEKAQRIAERKNGCSQVSPNSFVYTTVDEILKHATEAHKKLKDKRPQKNSAKPQPQSSQPRPYRV